MITTDRYLPDIYRYKTWLTANTFGNRQLLGVVGFLFTEGRMINK